MYKMVISMRKKCWIFCILLLLVFIFTLSACVVDGYDSTTTYNGMRFMFFPHKTENNEKDYYYAAGELIDKNVENYFIPMLVNDLPVRAFGWDGFASEIAMNLKDFALQKLYFPGTIIEQYKSEYISYVYKDIQIFYCGEVINLFDIFPNVHSSYMVDYYVSAEKYCQFENTFNLYPYGPTCCSRINRANISYRLNSEDMCEYYYVDNIEAGNKIENIPPEPTRKGYTFGGWYTEKECINIWDFDNIPTVSDNEETFVEFTLYAKWIKK